MDPVLTGHRRQPDGDRNTSGRKRSTGRLRDCGASGRLVKNEEAGALIESL